MTKVNFKALDQYVIKPVGIYGSKEEIVRLLLELGVADDSLYVAYYVFMYYAPTHPPQGCPTIGGPEHSGAITTSSSFWTVHSSPSRTAKQCGGTGLCHLLA